MLLKECRESVFQGCCLRRPPKHCFSKRATKMSDTELCLPNGSRSNHCHLACLFQASGSLYTLKVSRFSFLGFINPALGSYEVLRNLYEFDNHCADIISMFCYAIFFSFCQLCITRNVLLLSINRILDSVPQIQMKEFLFAEKTDHHNDLFFLNLILKL